MKRISLPTRPIVPPEAVERLQRKFVERKELEERERFWKALQDKRQPTVDFSRLGALW